MDIISTQENILIYNKIINGIMYIQKTYQNDTKDIK